MGLIADTALLDNLLKKAQYRQVVDALQKQSRVKVPYAEYLEIAKSHGLDEAEAKQLSKALHESGQILHFTQSADLSNTLIVKPAELTASVLKLLDIHGKYSHKFIADATTKLAALQEELKPLEATRSDIVKRAYAHADRILLLCFGYLLLQGAAVARLTWWELSWDIMEPVTYMLTFSTAALGFSYFLFTKNEYTYESLRDRLARRRRDKLFKKLGFDENKYQSLLQQIESLKEDLKAPELRLLGSVVAEASAAAGNQ